MCSFISALTAFHLSSPLVTISRNFPDTVSPPLGLITYRVPNHRSCVLLSDPLRSSFLQYALHQSSLCHMSFVRLSVHFLYSLSHSRPRCCAPRHTVQLVITPLSYTVGLHTYMTLSLSLLSSSSHSLKALSFLRCLVSHSPRQLCSAMHALRCVVRLLHSLLVVSRLCLRVRLAAATMCASRIVNTVRCSARFSV
jgi:hypothetical protein